MKHFIFILAASFCLIVVSHGADAKGLSSGAKSVRTTTVPTKLTKGLNSNSSASQLVSATNSRTW